MVATIVVAIATYVHGLELALIELGLAYATTAGQRGAVIPPLEFGLRRRRLHWPRAVLVLVCIPPPLPWPRRAKIPLSVKPALGI